MAALSDDLSALGADFLAEEFEGDPILASILGLDGFDDQLGDFSADAFERRTRRAAHWHERFSAVDAGGLSADESADRDMALATLRGRTLLADWADWRRDPTIYLSPCFTGVQALFQHRLRDEADLVAAAIARLEQIPSVLAAARQNLDPTVVAPLLVERAVDQARVGEDFVRAVVPAMVVDPDLRRRIGQVGQRVAPVFAAFTAWLTEDLAHTACGDWALGEARYTALLRERELLDLDTAALYALGRHQYDALDEQMRQVASRVPGGRSDWHVVMESLNADHPPTLEAMRAEYQAATERARRFLREHDLVSFAQDEQCRVVPAPVFQRGVLAVASYFGPPLMTNRRVGHFFVPFTPEGADPEQVEQRLRTNSRASIPTIAVHEAYPGHHWHTSWAAANPSRLRKVLRTPYFSEGWALYAERVMHDHGFFTDPGQELAHLDARIFRATRIMVDTLLHTGEMSFDQAVGFLVARSSLSAQTARAEVRRYCAWPTQASAYLTGSLRIEQIRDRWRDQHPGAPLREFHDRIAGSGRLALGLAERLVLG
jgi:Uncharacterized protein conserved in bacteria